MGVSYLVILILIGLIVSFINRRKREAIITGVLYALVSYIISYPMGLFLADYMPTTDIVIKTSTMTVATNLLIGALIPMIIAFVICAITAVIGSNIAKSILKYTSTDDEDEGYYFTDRDENDNETSDVKNNIRQKANKMTRKEKDKRISLTPIDKAKMKRESGEDND